MMGQMENLNTGSIDQYYKDYMGYLHEVALKTKISDLNKIIDVFIETYNQNGTLYFIGNGGSAATASHFAEDLAEVGRKCKTKLFKCLSLTDNVPYITAVGNDYGYSKIFVKQLEGLFTEKDVLISITASGNSPNIIQAIEYVKTIGGTTIGFLGFDGGRASKICDMAIVADTNKGEYGPAEDMHMILVHLITSFLYFKLAGKRKGLNYGL